MGMVWLPKSPQCPGLSHHRMCVQNTINRVCCCVKEQMRTGSFVDDRVDAALSGARSSACIGGGSGSFHGDGTFRGVVVVWLTGGVEELARAVHDPVVGGHEPTEELEELCIAHPVRASRVWIVSAGMATPWRDAVGL